VRVGANVPLLDVAVADEDEEAAVVPLLPDGREEHGAVAAVRGERGEEQPREERVERRAGQVDRHDTIVADGDTLAS
jgi:hypothetical protein